MLSPTQVRTFLDCSAKWWFRYGLRLPESSENSETDFNPGLLGHLPSRQERRLPEGNQKPGM
jgi:hypothetical protein